MIPMPVCRDVMRDVFVNWSNVFAGFVSRAIAGRRAHSIMRREAFVVSGSMRFISFAARACKKLLLAPESHRHQARHVERGASRGNRSDQPDEPAERDIRRLRCFPENLVLGPEAAERNDAADRRS